MATLASDSFNRADGSLGMADVGGAWTASVGTWTISSNQAANASGDGANAFLAGVSVADVVVSATMAVLPNSTTRFDGVMARRVDNNNFYVAWVNSAGTVRLQKRVGGTFTQLGTDQVGALTAGQTLGLSCIGTTIQALVDGVAVVSVTDSGVTSAGVVGMRHASTSGSTGRWDNFLAVDTAATVNVGLPSETDSALTVAAVKTGARVTAGLATETDAALTVAAVVVGAVVVVGIATETDEALTATVATITPVTLTPGQAEETDSALAATVVVGSVVSVGFAAETDTALTATVAVGLLVAVGQAEETDSALTATVVEVTGETIAVGFATETDTALSVTITYDYTVTDTSNDDDGIYLGDGYAQVVWEPNVVPIPAIRATATDQFRIVAHVIDTPPPPGIEYEPAVAREASIDLPLDRVLIDGVDWTYFRDAPAIVENYRLIDPLLYGGARITLAGINPQFPDDELGDLVERFQFARVRIQRVLDGEVVATDYKGFVSRVDTSGISLSLEVGGQAAGALSQMYVPQPAYRRKQDIEHICVDLLRDARVQAKKHDGLAFPLLRRSGADGLSIFNEYVALWKGATGDEVTFTPNADGVYRKTVKNTSTIDATAYIDNSLVTQSLAQDFMEQYTRVYAHGFTAAGELVTNLKNPGLTQGEPTEFPLVSGTLQLDMTDADTTTGAGVTTVQQLLAVYNFLDINDVDPGVYGPATAAAVRRFQRWSKLNVTGEVGENAWDALFNLPGIGYSLDEAREYPTAQDARTFKWIRTANGTKWMLNPDYDPHFIPNDLFVDVGGPFGHGEINGFAESKLAPEGGVWTGTLTFRSGLIWGEHTPDDPLTADDVMDRRDLLPNMRLSLPWFGGTEQGIVVYVSGVEHDPEETQCLVSTVPQTTMETWEAIERRREAKSNPGRAWSGHTRASQVRNDVAVQWDTSSGWIANPVALVAGWNHVAVPAGQSGIVQRIRIELEVPAPFACLLTQKETSTEALNNNDHTALPLVDPRPLFRPWYEIESVVEWFEGRGWLDAWGTEKQPCGYDPSRKEDELGSTDQSPTGLFKEAAGFNYETDYTNALHLYIWVEEGNVMLPGRILRNQRTTDL